VTYEGATPIRSAKSFRLISAVSSQAASLLIEPHYSVVLNFSQDESFSDAAWKLRRCGMKLPAMGKKVVPRFKPERPKHFIREWRRYRELTQERLAERVNMSVASISQLETGKQGYSQETLEKLADALSCQPGELLMRDPLRDDAPWSILDSLKPETRAQAITVLRALYDAEKGNKAA
jgi:transcriptional regulator with XRE-family HTH domain